VGREGEGVDGGVTMGRSTARGVGAVSPRSRLPLRRSMVDGGVGVGVVSRDVARRSVGVTGVESLRRFVGVTSRVDPRRSEGVVVVDGTGSLLPRRVRVVSTAGFTVLPVLRLTLVVPRLVSSRTGVIGAGRTTG
jgi:hypothetical protein